MYAFYILMDYPNVEIEDMIKDIYKNHSCPVAIITDRNHPSFQSALKNREDTNIDIIAIVYCINYPKVYEV